MNIDGTTGNKYQGATVTRPYDFGTDAIERQRVSLGQSMIDADFEYGLQATKWQTLQELRKFPSFYEVPGSDFTFSNIATDGTLNSNITVYFSNAVSLPPPIGSVLSVSGLANPLRSADRAEGFFLVTSNVGTSAGAFANTCNYIAKGAVSPAANIQTAYSVARSGGIFNNLNSKIQFASVALNGSANVVVSTNDAHGLVAGTPLAAACSNTIGFNGSFFVNNVTSINTFNIVATSTLSTCLLNAANTSIYMNPYSYTVHRPFDGGVLLSPVQPSYGASVIRQSKKVFRYQSGKGLLWSSGTLFCPNNDISSITVDGTAVGSTLTIISEIAHGAPQPGAQITIKGVVTPGINGTYNVSSIIESTTITVITKTALSSTNIVLGDQPRFIMSSWHGASVRAGCFEDQNGLFWEYDGQTLFAVKRSSTFQISGTVTVNPNGQIITGSLSATTGTITGADVVGVAVGDTSATFNVISHTLLPGMYITNMTGFLALGTIWVVGTPTTTSITMGFSPATTTVNSQPTGTWLLPTTRFQDQLKVNDRFVLRGMTHQVTSIQGQGIITFNPPYRGTAAITTATPVKIAKIKEFRVPQSQFNRDTIDGSGLSGYRVDLSKMQMIGLQYTWYGAGFVDFMIRGANGNWVYCHRFKNNNVNDEAYMRTGNMPVRYELVNECQSAQTSLATVLTNSTSIFPVNEVTSYFPNAGTLMIDNELVSYTGKTANTFTGCVRGASLNYNVTDVSRVFTGQSASTHLANTTISLVSTTCAPSLTHWGSALLMDGQFDSDRGYFFNYSNTAVTLGASVGSKAIAFLIRLAPSVSNGIVGDIGNRELLNRAQLLLQKLEVTSSQNINVTGILNPSGLTIDSTKWVNINSVANGSQPSFAQIYTGVAGIGSINGGERIFSTIVQTNNQNNLDLTGLKEMANGVIGGNQTFPDGPDVLCIVVTNLTVNANSPQVNLFWTEAQA